METTRTLKTPGFLARNRAENRRAPEAGRKPRAVAAPTSEKTCLAARPLGEWLGRSPSMDTHLAFPRQLEVMKSGPPPALGPRARATLGNRKRWRGMGRWVLNGALGLLALSCVGAGFVCGAGLRQTDHQRDLVRLSREVREQSREKHQLRLERQALQGQVARLSRSAAPTARSGVALARAR